MASTAEADRPFAVTGGRPAMTVALSPLSPFIGLSLLGFASQEVPSSHGATSPTMNVSIVAAMPAEVESVGIVRLSDLTTTDSPFRRSFETWTTAAEPPLEGDLDDWLPSQLAAAGLALVAYGGSDFVAPWGIGAARANLRQVYVATSSFRRVREALPREVPSSRVLWAERCPAVCAFVADIVEQAGSMGREIPAQCFVAFVGDGMAVTARSEADLAALVEGVTSPDPALPERWRSVGSHAELESPVLILRRLIPPMEEDASGLQRLVETKDLTFAAWVADTSAPVFSVAVESPLPISEARAYFCELAFETEPGAECGPPWTRRDGVLVGQTAPLEPEDGHHYVDLLFLYMFGMWLAL